ncbi:MAG: hypothetical protein GY940_12515 [bacterium]|nr:hypothetical protein [bacterium]
MIERVIHDLGVKEKELQAFEDQDPINPGNLLAGFLCRKSDHRYGALAITHINGKEAYQVRYATPKQHYPFGKDGQFHFPKVREIEVYEKLDGTNVCAYRYSLGDRVFQTYKLRLCPVLRNSKFGDFLDLWREMLERYPQLSRVCEVNNCHVSFELYGNRNTHLITYDVPSEIALLFGIDDRARIITPHRLDNLGLPAAQRLATIGSKQQLVDEYNRFRRDIEAKNVPNPDETIRGSEGVVWYLTDLEDVTHQFKCKPDSVEQIHWGAGAIEINTIKATAHNVLETEDFITYDATVLLLKEEFSDEQVELSDDRIKKVVAELQEWYEFQKKVFEIYGKIGIDFHQDKGTVMREMSKHFAKNQMKKVGFILKESKG